MLCIAVAFKFPSHSNKSPESRQFKIGEVGEMMLNKKYTIWLYKHIRLPWNKFQQKWFNFSTIYPGTLLKKSSSFPQHIINQRVSKLRFMNHKFTSSASQRSNVFSNDGWSVIRQISFIFFSVMIEMMELWYFTNHKWLRSLNCVNGLAVKDIIGFPKCGVFHDFSP